MINVRKISLFIDFWGNNIMIQISDKERELKSKLTLSIK